MHWKYMGEVAREVCVEIVDKPVQVDFEKYDCFQNSIKTSVNNKMEDIIMNNSKKKMICMIMILVMAFSAIVVAKAEYVKASSEPVVPHYSAQQYMFSPEWKTLIVFSNTKMKKGAKVNVSVNKKSVASAKWDVKQKIVLVTAKKPGTVKVTLKIKQGGKTYTYTTKMTWVKYANPLKSLKIGKTNWKVSYFNENTQAMMKEISGKNRVQISLKAGYKMTGIRFCRNNIYKNIKNGTKINFTKKGKGNTVLFIYYKDSKGNNGTLRLFAGDKDQTLF